MVFFLRAELFSSSREAGFIPVRFKRDARSALFRIVQRRARGSLILPKETSHQSHHGLHRVHGRSGSRLSLPSSDEPDEASDEHQWNQNEHWPRQAAKEPNPSRWRSNFDNHVLFAQLRYQGMVANVRNTTLEQDTLLRAPRG